MFIGWPHLQVIYRIPKFRFDRHNLEHVISYTKINKLKLIIG